MFVVVSCHISSCFRAASLGKSGRRKLRYDVRRRNSEIFWCRKTRKVHSTIRVDILTFCFLSLVCIVITAAPPSVCVSAVLVSLAVWIQNQKGKKVCLRMRMSTSKQYANVYVNQSSYVRDQLRECRSIRSGTSGLPYYCAPLVCFSEIIESLAVWRHYKPKNPKKT